MAEECRRAEDMFQGLHAARLAASQKPLNQLVSTWQAYAAIFLTAGW